MKLLIGVGIFLTILVVRSGCAPSERRPRQSPFSRMGASPFHSSMGGMSGPMSGPMGGMGHMGPAMGGPTMGGQSHGSSSSMFRTSVGLGCTRREIVCPKWCLAVDENGCKSCPCGPAGGMNAVEGGPSGSPMGGAMSGGPMSGALPMGGAMPMGSGYSGTSGGGTGGVASGSFSGGGVNVGGGGGTVTGSGGTSVGGGSFVTAKPKTECSATLLCTSTCKGYVLGSTNSNGCRSCSCPSSHHVTTTTISYIVPAKKECTVTAHCMRSCDGGYVMSQTDGHGCPECSCLKVEKPYVPPIEIAVEPPPDKYEYPIEYAVEPPEYTNQIQSYSLTCAAHSCNSGCTVGYKCGRDGCPSCECIHPAVVGLTSVQQIYVEKPVRCRNTLACPSSCSLGYKCGVDGCPTCECLVATATYTNSRPQYTAQTCTHTLTCASTCTHGYELFTDGTSACSKCACKQQVVYETRPQYSVQRLGPQYEIVPCQSTDSCASKCPHGYEITRTEGSCQKCQCKQAPVYYAVQSSGNACENCHESYYTSGNTYSSSGSYVIGTSGGSIGSGTSYVLSNGNGGVASGTSYIVTGGIGGSEGSYTSRGANGIALYGSSECEPLPPDCQPSCIKYDTPHCRRCVCETSYVRFAHG